jgi:hypothetical protein
MLGDTCRSQTMPLRCSSSNGGDTVFEARRDSLKVYGSGLCIVASQSSIVERSDVLLKRDV